MKTKDKSPVVILNILFIVVCLIWGGHHYVSYVDELHETIELQDRAIRLQQLQLEIIQRVMIPDESNWSPVYPSGPNIYEQESFLDDMPL